MDGDEDRTGEESPKSGPRSKPRVDKEARKADYLRAAARAFLTRGACCLDAGRRRRRRRAQARLLPDLPIPGRTDRSPVPPRPRHHGEIPGRKVGRLWLGPARPLSRSQEGPRDLPRRPQDLPRRSRARASMRERLQGRLHPQSGNRLLPARRRRTSRAFRRPRDKSLPHHDLI